VTCPEHAMPFTIDIASDHRQSQVDLHVPSPSDHGVVWSLVATLHARLVTRRLLRRLRQSAGATVHLSEHLRSDIGLPPSLPSPRSHWEIRT
jgi:hypothetical protein